LPTPLYETLHRKAVEAGHSLSKEVEARLLRSIQEENIAEHMMPSLDRLGELVQLLETLLVKQRQPLTDSPVSPDPRGADTSAENHGTTVLSRVAERQSQPSQEISPPGLRLSGMLALS
jgi:hypothetical protein